MNRHRQWTLTYKKDTGHCRLICYWTANISASNSSPKTNQPATSQASEDEPSMLVKSLSFRGIEGIATSQELEKQLPELVGTEATLRDSFFIYSYLVFKVSSKVRQERTAHLTLAGIWEIFFSAIASSSSSSSSSSVISPLIIFRNKSAKC